MCSNGRKGYMNVIREEILYLAKPTTTTTATMECLEDSNIYAIYREGIV